MHGEERSDNDVIEALLETLLEDQPSRSRIEAAETLRVHLHDTADMLIVYCNAKDLSRRQDGARLKLLEAHAALHIRVCGTESPCLPRKMLTCKSVYVRLGGAGPHFRLFLNPCVRAAILPRERSHP